MTVCVPIILYNACYTAPLIVVGLTQYTSTAGKGVVKYYFKHEQECFIRIN